LDIRDCWHIKPTKAKIWHISDFPVDVLMISFIAEASRVAGELKIASSS
jgi:hypothetical protein